MDNTREKNAAEVAILSFDPIVLVQDVLKRWLIILLAVVAVGVSTYIVTDLSYEPVYRTNATFAVISRGSASTVYSNLNSTTNLASVFTELLNSSILRKTIAQELGASSFDGTITTSVLPGTNLIAMNVTASDPRTAFLAAKAVIEHHETLTYKIIDGIVLEVLQNPVMPVAPSNRSDAMGRMKQMMAVTAILSVLILMLQSYARDTVRSEKEAQAKLDCLFLGQIPHEWKYKTLASMFRKRRTSILITNPLTGFHFVEAMRKLRRRLERRMGDGKVLMVTSLLENEGKSTLAVNLALDMEQQGHRVLLIDCDLRKPACNAILEQKNFTGGVRDVLKNRVQLSEALIRYEKKNLYLLLEKKGDSQSGELISSERMRQLLDWAREHFDLVVLDLPPIAAASDAESMKELADASVLVVRQNVASAKALNKAVEVLDGGHAKLLGAVLNNVHSTRLGTGEGYGYGYGRYNKYNHYSKKG